MAPPISTVSANFSIVLQQFDLVGDFGAAHDGNVGPRGVSHRFAQVFELFLHQQSRRAGGQVMSNALRGGVGTMRGTERVVHVDLGERGKLLRKLRHVLFFFRMEAQVFEQQHVAVLERLGRGFRFRADAIGREGHGLAEQLRQARGGRFQTHFGIHLALGPAQVRSQNQPAAALQDVLNGGQRGLDARVIGDFAGVVQGYIEIHAHENALAF